MRRNQSLLLFSVVLFLCAFSSAQTATGVISAKRVIDWSDVGIPGGVPSRSTVCASLSPGASASQINSAIAACPANQVVSLAAGTYNLSSGIDFANNSNVTLRGAGADKTFLIFGGAVSCQGLRADVCVRNGDNSSAGDPSHTANWTAGYAKGTTQITLSSTSGLVVGNLLVLDQRNDASDTGGIFVCEQQGLCASEGPAGAERSGRSQSQIVRVAGISGNTVTISPGLYMPNWRASQSPGAFWANDTVTGDGVENLSLDHSNGGATSGVVFFNAYRSWLKGVRSISPDRNHVWLFQSAGIVVRDNYFYATQNSAQQSYGVEPFLTSDDLVENNIFQHISAPITVNGPASGSVFAYNYSINDFSTLSASSMSASIWLHSAGVDSILFEGNDGAGFFGDNIHGTHNFITAFRNHWLGWETGKSSQTWPVLIAPQGRYYNLVGNILGKAGYHNSYQGSSPTSIYNVGSNINGISADSLVSTTLLRWGNYDTVNGAVRFLLNEIPTVLNLFASASPTSQSLPASFYLSGKPNWWGSANPYPAIGPDVTGGSDSSGHAHAIPAGTCYATSSKDGSGVLSFNAAGCYGASSGTGSGSGSGSGGTTTPPAPPTNLTIIVQ